MEIKLDSLIPYEFLKKNLEDVFELVERNGKVVILKDNKPMYILIKNNMEEMNEELSGRYYNSKYTLQEAMKIVLSEAENQTMHASELADEIFRRKLYLQRNGEKAQYTQIRARCSNYPELFEGLSGNFIKLK